jgi:hypothetical protein
VHILWVPCALQEPAKLVRETPCALLEPATRTTPTPRTTGGSTGGDSDGDGTGRPGRSGQPRRPEHRGRHREPTGIHGHAENDRRATGAAPRSRDHGRSRRATAGGDQGDGDGQPGPTTRATGTGDRNRRSARRTSTAAADAIGGPGRQLHGAGSGRPRPRRGSQDARQHERLARRARQRDRRSGGRAAGPLDLIHRGAPHLLQDASGAQRSRPTTRPKWPRPRRGVPHTMPAVAPAVHPPPGAACR